MRSQRLSPLTPFGLVSLCAGFLVSPVPAVAMGPLAAPAPTLRVEYAHAGNAREERFALLRVVEEPLSWPGSAAQAVDDADLGNYRFEVVDRASRRVVFARGFSSVYGEWETTGEATKIDRAFAESVRFPRPEAPVQLRLAKRDRANDFRELWSIVIDPADPAIDRSPPPSAGERIAIQVSGPSPEKVDLLLLGDGYTEAEREKCVADGRRLAEILFDVEPFRGRRTDFNVWGLCPAAAESGISRPSLDIYRRSPAGATYDAFGSERYILTFDDRALRDLASQAPYEFVEVFTNSVTYGGGGIFGQYSTVAAGSLWAPYLFVHELAHHFAGLADEYYTSDVAYVSASERLEPWEANVTALHESGRLKWRDLVAPSTPLPTSWEKEAFEERSRAAQAERRKIRAERRPESEMDALFTRQRDDEERRLGADPNARVVGAFEGANYEAKGYYRPQVDCIMFSRDRVPFCAVCRRAIEHRIDFHVR